MIEKKEKYILKSILTSGIPQILKQNCEMDLIYSFEVIDSGILDLLKGRELKDLQYYVLTKEEKNKINSIINNNEISIELRTELKFYYQLLLLSEQIFKKESKNN